MILSAVMFSIFIWESVDPLLVPVSSELQFFACPH